MRTIRKGDTGDDVKAAQVALNDLSPYPTIKPDGIFGELTEESTMAFQAQEEVLADGIIGPVTWELLGFEDTPSDDWENGTVLPWVSVPADEYGDGYDSFKLREDVAEAYDRVYETVHALGGLISSSGSYRSLNTTVRPNQSATSLHYLGRALDLHVGSGMSNLAAEPFIIEKDADHDRYWIVWVKVETGGEERILNAWHHPSQSERKIAGRFLNLTELFKANGFERIRARKSYSASNYGASEWWHFQYELGLIAGETKFGDELLKVYTLTELEGKPPWKYRDGLWHQDWF